MASTINTASALLGNLGTGGLSGTDPYARVNKALLAQNASLQKLSANIGSDQAKLSALGKLSSSLFDFQQVAQSLSGGGLTTGASSSNTNVLSALTNANAKAGTANIEVKQLASAQVQTSKALASADTAIGLGTLNVSVNGKTTSLRIDESNNTLNGIAKALQAIGVDAAVSKSGKGYALEVTAKPGLSNTVALGAAGDTAFGAILNFSQTKAAQNAQLTVDGKAVQSDSNVVTGVIPGVALALKATGKSTVTVAQDDKQIGSNIANFVEAFNSLNSKLRGFASADLKTDPALQQVSTRLQQLAGSPGLARIGLTVGANGNLSVDNTKLQAALTADPAGVGRLFVDNGNGVADRFSDAIGQFLGSSGVVAREQASVSREITSLSNKKDQLNKALSVQSQLLAQQYGSGANPTGTSSLFDFLA
ncbi:flagellar filament capping protein FliD [Massilia sp. TS11]|uniref:flagellar filament capping protein FliD n=1 Tax=Massilia sp. TS11 TaxID=2908003 RepID=UPI001EDAFEB6|nr:flagellar filament capping protein FliD [Massilia sp. TS11]MCG2584247.1 flagellar filament capping protein FliD [Massilia sp. TS11]